MVFVLKSGRLLMRIALTILMHQLRGLLGPMCQCPYAAKLEKMALPQVSLSTMLFLSQEHY